MGPGVHPFSMQLPPNIAIVGLQLVPISDAIAHNVIKGIGFQRAGKRANISIMIVTVATRMRLMVLARAVDLYVMLRESHIAINRPIA